LQAFLTEDSGNSCKGRGISMGVYGMDENIGGVNNLNARLLRGGD
jgi:hypothetical protein